MPAPPNTPAADLERAKVPHFATFTSCDVCQVKALGRDNLPGGWVWERRGAFQGGAGNAMILCDECAPKLEALRLTVIDRLLETRGGLNSNRRWDPPGSPKHGPVCPKEIRDWNERETLGPAHRALLELQVREFEGLPEIPVVNLARVARQLRSNAYNPATAAADSRAGDESELPDERDSPA